MAKTLTEQLGEQLEDVARAIRSAIDDAPRQAEESISLGPATLAKIENVLTCLDAAAEKVRYEVFDQKEVDEQIAEAKDAWRNALDDEVKARATEVEAVSAAADKFLGPETLDESFEKYMLRRALRDLRATTRKNAPGRPAAPLWTHD